MKRFVLSLLISAIALVAFSTPVDLQRAATIAAHAYYQKVNLYLKQVDLSELQIEEHFNIQQNGETLLYAFNFSELGYIIISADDAMIPVIGYSFESQYITTDQPNNFSGWIKELAGTVKFIRENNIPATPEIKLEWTEYSDISNLSLKDGGKSIEPLLTSIWDQDTPYNYYCPPRTTQPNSQGKALVGCVATAMSQIMLYWRYPNQGSGSHSYTLPQYGTISANFGATTYDWNGMMDDVSSFNDPVALICFHAGVSVDMDYYLAEGSGAFSIDVPYALRTYFGYSNTIQYLARNTTPFATWKGYIEDELDLLRPVYFSGQSSDGGHAFVCDGYHSDGTYHMNYGWEGYGNGWFDISIPSSFEFYTQQAIIRRIYPGDAAYPYGCAQSFETANMVGSLTDGSGPLENYDPNASCSWLIDPQTAMDSVRKIQLSFTYIDTETDDIITIYDGETTSSPVLGTYSGSVTPSTLSSTGNKMLLVFNADGDANTGTGFKVEYTSVLPNYCSGVTNLTEPSGSFDDGSGTFYYKNLTNCSWKITPDWAADLTITFTEFNTEEGSDILKIYDYSNNQLVATYSGEYISGNMPDPITIPSGKMFLMFTTNGAINRPGWAAEWQIGNTSVENQLEGFDKLMVFPNPASNLLNISFEAGENKSFEISLMTVSGTVVYNQNNMSVSGYYVNSIDISDFAKGIYILRLKNDNGTINRKVIIK